MARTLQGLFRSDIPARDKFVSRLFGIFNEEIVRCWGKASQAPYVELGRPTVKPIDAQRGSTLDFTFRAKRDGRVYVAEMKCELEYENYRYLTLESPYQLDHHSKAKEGFRIFVDVARNASAYAATVKGRTQTIDGAILVWGSVTEQGRSSVIEQLGFADVLSLETIILDLQAWRNQDYTDLVSRYETWCGDFFAGLRSLGSKSQIDQQS